EMLGVGRKWQFDCPNGTPWPLKVIIALLLANFAGGFVVADWAERYGQREPTRVSPFPIHFKGGLIMFVPTWLGLYEQWSFWLHFAFLALFGLMLWRYTQTGQVGRVP